MLNNRQISDKMTLHAKRSLKESASIARFYNSSNIRPEHLFLAIYLEKGSLGNLILKGMGIKKKFIDKIFSEKTAKAPDLKNENSKSAPSFSQSMKNIITRAYYLANTFGYPYVGTEHLIYALIESSQQNQKIQQIMLQIEKNQKSNPLEKIFMNENSFSNLSKMLDLPDISLAKKNNPSHSPNTPFLDQFCRDMNETARKKSHTLIGRKKEIQRIGNILGRKNKNNPILVGESGVGKTAIVEGLAERINSGNVPAALFDKRILCLDLALLVAGTTFRGEFEERLKEVIFEASENKDVILFIDEIHSLSGAGNANGGLDAANILKPALSRGEIQCIGATTFSEYKKYIEKDTALERRFQKVEIAEPTIKETRQILRGVKKYYEKFHNVILDPEILDLVADLSARYIQDRFLPDKALDVIDEASVLARHDGKISALGKKIKNLENEEKKLEREKNKNLDSQNYENAIKLRKKEIANKEKIKEIWKKLRSEEQINPVSITASEITSTIASLANIPVEKISASPSQKLNHLQKNLSQSVIGQKEAVQKIFYNLLRSVSGVSDPYRPMGSFLFLGPTGVGKTLLSKMLAREFFENSASLIRVDMSEFMEKHNVSKLIGAPAGYIGYGEGGGLTEKIRHSPYSIVLFDEIEKAHPDIFNILLQILEDGFLTDAEGRRVNFRNTIIILTSNLGTSEFTNAAKIGFKSKKDFHQIHQKFNGIKENVMEELKKTLRPEFLNRLSDIIVFNALGEKEIKKITRLELKKLKQRLMEKGIQLEYSQNSINLLARKSISFDQGARLVRKNIEDLVENRVAEILMKEKMKNKKIKLEVKENKIIAK